MKLITHSQRSWKNLLRCGATAACLSVALAGYAQSSGSGSGSGSGTGSSTSSDRDRNSSSNASASSNRNNDKSAKADQKFIRKLTEANQREMAIAQLGVERATNPQVKAFAQKMVTDHRTMEREFASVTSSLGISASATAMRGSTGSMDDSSSASSSNVSGSSTASSNRTNSGSSTTSGVGSPSATTAPEYSSANTGTGTTASSTNPASGAGQTGGMASSAGSSGASSATGTASDEYNRDHASMSRSGSQDRSVRKLMDEKSGKDFDKAFVKAMVKEHKQAEDLLKDAAEDKDHSEAIRSFANKNLPTIRAHLAEVQQLEKSID